ncbi:MAG: hypothetical protein J5958_06725 [Clostridia bacterium]|nr:hypothetical protein [Clostridia bacterium]
MKAYLDVNDVSERFGVKRDKAYSLIRAIKAVSYPPGVGALGKGKILPSELERWEQMFGRELTADEKNNLKRR